MLKMNEVLKASKGLYVDDSFAMLWGKQLGGWEVTELTGTLPMTFRSNGTALINYRIFGTADGAGVQTENQYTIPLTVTSGAERKDSDIYIGDSKLGAEEYVDYGEQKVYKRTKNLFDKSTAILGKEIRGDSIADNADWAITPLIPVEPQSYYSTLSFGVARLEYMSENDNNPTRTAAGSQYPTLSTTHFIRLNLAISNLTTATLISGSTPPTSYIPYLQPTDPPFPLPAIETFKGENTLDSTVEVGEVTIKGMIKEAE